MPETPTDDDVDAPGEHGQQLPSSTDLPGANNFYELLGTAPGQLNQAALEQLIESKLGEAQRESGEEFSAGVGEWDTVACLDAARAVLLDKTRQEIYNILLSEVDSSEAAHNVYCSLSITDENKPQVAGVADRIEETDDVGVEVLIKRFAVDDVETIIDSHLGDESRADPFSASDIAENTTSVGESSVQWAEDRSTSGQVPGGSDTTWRDNQTGNSGRPKSSQPDGIDVSAEDIVSGESISSIKPTSSSAPSSGSSDRTASQTPANSTESTDGSGAHTEENKGEESSGPPTGPAANQYDSTAETSDSSAPDDPKSTVIDDGDTGGEETPLGADTDAHSYQEEYSAGPRRAPSSGDTSEDLTDSEVSAPDAPSSECSEDSRPAPTDSSETAESALNSAVDPESQGKTKSNRGFDWASDLFDNSGTDEEGRRATYDSSDDDDGGTKTSLGSDDRADDILSSGERGESSGSTGDGDGTDGSQPVPDRENVTASGESTPESVITDAGEAALDELISEVSPGSSAVERPDQTDSINTGPGGDDRSTATSGEGGRSDRPPATEIVDDAAQSGSPSQTHQDPAQADHSSPVDEPPPPSDHSSAVEPGLSRDETTDMETESQRETDPDDGPADQSETASADEVGHELSSRTADTSGKQFDLVGEARGDTVDTVGVDATEDEFDVFSEETSERESGTVADDATHREAAVRGDGNQTEAPKTTNTDVDENGETTDDDNGGDDSGSGFPLVVFKQVEPLFPTGLRDPPEDGGSEGESSEDSSQPPGPDEAVGVASDDAVDPTAPDRSQDTQQTSDPTGQPVADDTEPLDNDATEAGGSAGTSDASTDQSAGRDTSSSEAGDSDTTSMTTDDAEAVPDSLASPGSESTQTGETTSGEDPASAPRHARGHGRDGRSEETTPEEDQASTTAASDSGSERGPTGSPDEPASPPPAADGESVSATGSERAEQTSSDGEPASMAASEEAEQTHSDAEAPSSTASEEADQLPSDGEPASTTAPEETEQTAVASESPSEDEQSRTSPHSLGEASHDDPVIAADGDSRDRPESPDDEEVLDPRERVRELTDDGEDPFDILFDDADTRTSDLEGAVEDTGFEDPTDLRIEEDSHSPDDSADSGEPKEPETTEEASSGGASTPDQPDQSDRSDQPDGPDSVVSPTTHSDTSSDSTTAEASPESSGVEVGGTVSADDMIVDAPPNAPERRQGEQGGGSRGYESSTGSGDRDSLPTAGTERQSRLSRALRPQQAAQYEVKDLAGANRRTWVRRGVYTTGIGALVTGVSIAFGSTQSLLGSGSLAFGVGLTLLAFVIGATSVRPIMSNVSPGSFTGESQASYQRPIQVGTVLTMVGAGIAGISPVHPWSYILRVGFGGDPAGILAVLPVGSVPVSPLLVNAGVAGLSVGALIFGMMSLLAGCSYAVWFDRFVRGRPHQLYAWDGLLMLPVALLVWALSWSILAAREGIATIAEPIVSAGAVGGPTVAAVFGLDRGVTAATLMTLAPVFAFGIAVLFGVRRQLLSD